MATGNRLGGRVAIVTGAGGPRGIGRAIALALARERAGVVVAGGRAADQVAGEIADMGQPSLRLRTDVSRESDVRSMVERTLEAFGQVDVLVNNAGILLRGGLLEVTVSDWERTLAVNLTGVLLCSQAVVRPMIERGAGGRIVNISSLCAHTGCPSQLSYAASKGGVEAMTLALAVDLAQYGITVNAIAPGGVYTGMATAPPPPGQEPARWGGQPIPVSGLPQDVAGAAVMLASEEAGWITGTVLVVDGGKLAGR